MDVEVELVASFITTHDSYSLKLDEIDKRDTFSPFLFSTLWNYLYI